MPRMRLLLPMWLYAMPMVGMAVTLYSGAINSRLTDISVNWRT